MAGDRWNSQATTYASARHLLFRPVGVVSESFSRDYGYQQSATTALVSQTLHLDAVPYQKDQVVTNIGYAFASTVTAGMTQYHFSLWAHDTLPYIVPQKYTIGLTNGSTATTGCIAAGPINQNAQGRLITATSGIAGGTYVAGGSFGDIILSANYTGTTGPVTVTIGQYAAARYKLCTTGNVTTPVPPAGARKDRPLSGSITAAWTCPATGLYYHGIVMHASTMPDFIEQVTGTVADDYFANEAPIMQGNSSTGITNAASLPAQAAAITADRNRFYTYST